MAIIDMDGFEAGSVIMPNVGLANIAYPIPQVGRDGTGVSVSANNFPYNEWLYRYIISGSDTVFFHIGKRIDPGYFGGTTGGYIMFNVQTDGGAAGHLNCYLDGSGHVVLQRGAVGGGGAILQTSTQFFPSTVSWHSFQVKALIHSSSGECVIRVDGVEWINYTGNTRNGGTSTSPTRIHLGLGHFLDDWLINDTTGSANNTWTGEVSIQGIRPNGNGAFSDLIGSDGNSTDNYLLVDEYPFNTSDYVGSTTTLAKDTYDFSNLVKTGNVLAVGTLAYVAKSDAGPKFFRVLQRGGSGGLVESADLPLSTTYLPVVSPLWLTDGDGNPWTVARVNAAQFGVKVI